MLQGIVPARPEENCCRTHFSPSATPSTPSTRLPCCLSRRDVGRLEPGDVGVAVLEQVFISYSRHDSASEAEHLYRSLVRKLGKGTVFKDVDVVEIGEEWTEIVENAIKKSTILLWLIGPSYLHTSSIELELRTADQKGTVILPLLLGEANADDAFTDFPDDLAHLSHINAARIRLDHRESDLERLFQVTRLGEPTSRDKFGAYVEIVHETDHRMDVRFHHQFGCKEITWKRHRLRRRSRSWSIEIDGKKILQKWDGPYTWGPEPRYDFSNLPKPVHPWQWEYWTKSKGRPLEYYTRRADSVRILLDISGRDTNGEHRHFKPALIFISTIQSPYGLFQAYLAPDVESGSSAWHRIRLKSTAPDGSATWSPQ